MPLKDLPTEDQPEKAYRHCHFRIAGDVVSDLYTYPLLKVSQHLYRHQSTVHCEKSGTTGAGSTFQHLLLHPTPTRHCLQVQCCKPL